MLVDCTSGGDNIGYGKNWWGYARLLPQLKPSECGQHVCVNTKKGIEWGDSGWHVVFLSFTISCFAPSSKYTWPFRSLRFLTFPHFSRLKRCVREQERERQRALWRTASVLSDMGQGGDVEAYLSYQATHATGKCTLHFPEGIERCREEKFIWHEMRGTGNIISPVTRSFHLWLEVERERVCCVCVV